VPHFPRDILRWMPSADHMFGTAKCTTASTGIKHMVASAYVLTQKGEI
jgi:hypothetical protein